MPDRTALERARAVKRAHEEELMTFANVVAVGIGLRSVGGHFTEEVAIVVSVVEKYPDDELDPSDLIPREIEGVPIDVQKTGPLIAGAS
jgi:hypothetical protein